jgi:spore cortex biosynthesis protein YabQ
MVNENVFLLHALCLGLVIIFVYDIITIFRKAVPHHKFWISVEDLGFWLFCGVEVFLLMYRESNGTLRWFAVLGALAGMIVYKKTISKPFVKSMVWLLQKIIGLLQKVAALILKPVLWGKRKALGGVKTAAGKVSKGGRSSFRFCKKKLTQGFKVFKMGISKR